ncbi:MAG: DUF202 domain-containing protein [Elusimicrobia bacterium]|nr:DUF202 domain-containing protein [Elusimicrobiota bacterium]MDE2425541.1 DUF202 domain-containing protein [Elusimicrobiota bacterium]
MSDDAKSGGHLSDHLANERTYLAWIRTSIGLMAFGFVVEKFALFMRRLSYFLEKSGLPAEARPASSPGYSEAFGIAIVALGALLGLLAFTRFKKVQGQIEHGAYRPSMLLDVMLAVSVLALGLFLAGYLLRTI